MAEKRIGYLLIGALLLASCAHAPKTDFKLIRFIDLMTAANVVSSPFADGRFDAKSGLFVHEKNRLIMDGGSGGENPYLLKRKLVFRSTNLNALVAPPGSRYAFDVDIPPGSVMEFGEGILRGKNSEELRQRLNPPPGKVRFIVQIETKGMKMALCQESVDLPLLKGPKASKLISKRISLPPEGGKARITFVTEGPDGTFSFWGDPIIYAAGPKKRRVILISLDTLRADHLGCYGYNKPTTPNIDALAGDGALFVNHYAPASWTLPSHVSLLTALSCFSHGVNKADVQISSTITTLADLLRKQGFRNAAFTGGGFVSPVYGFAKGFDMYNESEGSTEFMDSARRLSEAASLWIENNRDKDFFLFLHTYQCHMPYSSPSPYDTMFLDPDYVWKTIDMTPLVGNNQEIYKPVPDRERRNVVGLYDGEIRYTDEALIGGLTAKLKSLGLYEDTMIILTSDHGEEFYEHGSWQHGHTLYDESIKVPLIVKFPGSRYKGRRVLPLVRLFDIAPTILDICGVPASASAGMDGKSLMPVLDGKEKKDRILLAYLTSYMPDSPMTEIMAMTVGRAKFILNKPLRDEIISTLTFPPKMPFSELEAYDLADDPAERNNVVSSKASMATRCIGIMKELQEKGRKRSGESVTIDSEVTEKLKALGYIH